jgi:hypothetical protein
MALSTNTALRNLEISIASWEDHREVWEGHGPSEAMFRGLTEAYAILRNAVALYEYAPDCFALDANVNLRTLELPDRYYDKTDYTPRWEMG